jgi:hypothetical protein
MAATSDDFPLNASSESRRVLFTTGANGATITQGVIVFRRLQGGGGYA